MTQNPPPMNGLDRPTSGGRRWGRMARILLGVVLLAVLVSRVDFDQLSIRWSPLIALAALGAVATLALAQALSALRWKVLLGPGGPRWAYLYRLYLIAAFFSLFLPTAVGGDAVRAAAATRSLGRPGQMVGTVLADRMLGVFALAVYLAVGLVVIGGPAGLGLNWAPSPKTMVLAGTGLGLGAGLIWLLRRKLGKVGRFAAEVLRTLASLAQAPGRLSVAIILGFAVQAVYVVTWIILARSLGLPVPTASFLVTVPLVSLSSMAPVTLSGVGVREGAWILLLGSYGVPAANALAMSLIYFGCWAVVAAIGGLLFAWRGTGETAGHPATTATT